MRILIVGGGGREHTLVYKIKQSPKVEKIFAAPGNGGMEKLAQCVPIEVADINRLLDFAVKEKIDFTVVGPEVPLTLGIVDIFKSKGLRIFGPDKKGAQLEGSKIWSKNFMKKYNIPTADYNVFNDTAKASEFIEKAKYPLVIKADGLAAGKGVVICKGKEEARGVLSDFMEKNTLGNAGKKVVIEEFLEGEELSIIAVTDGETILPLSSAQDHKKIYDNDEGPNTGGMGAYSPVPFLNKELEDKINKKVVFPTLRGLKKEGIDFRGVIYFGFIIKNNEPYVLEYNCRFGDPETQAILPRLESDLVELMEAVEEKKLSEWMKSNPVKWASKSSVCVVLASKGYPGSYVKGKEISGLDEAEGLIDSYVFHAGTIKKDNKIFTNGGRVLGVTALGDSLKDAQKKVYEAVKKISYENIYYRKDIAGRAIERGA
ncbi:MAG: phosphoribosylamine--glycine ligase [bacterium]|nr:phosphoribosylamine--glycine ligase [bacterium]